MPLYKVKLAKIVNKFPTEHTVYYDCKNVIELYKVIESRPDWERVTSFDIKSLASDEITGAAVIHRATVADG